MIANKYVIRHGVGRSNKYLPSFDKALLEAGVGNYNLVRLSSILPAGCKKMSEIDLKEGSLLPTAYSTITSDTEGDILFSFIGVIKPSDERNVGVIMEYSAKNITLEEGRKTLSSMLEEAMEIRKWEGRDIEWTYSTAEVHKGETVTTFACIAEW